VTDTHISREAIERRASWISEIVAISGHFGQDAARVERELEDEVRKAGSGALLDHLRLCGAIPESYGHDTSEEKLYSKYTDALIGVAFRHLGLEATVLTERADAADVEVAGEEYSFVADAKAFRLSRTAKNQKDFKVQAMDGWKRGRPFAIVVAPLYQLPRSSSQIYEQAAMRNVAILSYSHLCVLVRLADSDGADVAQRLLGEVLRTVEALHPTKSAADYWTSVNGALLEAGGSVPSTWEDEKVATSEAIAAAREEGLAHVAAQREAILRLSHEEALQRLITAHKLDSRAATIEAVGDNGLFGVGA
jgi:hypothetical protein